MGVIGGARLVVVGVLAGALLVTGTQPLFATESAAAPKKQDIATAEKSVTTIERSEAKPVRKFERQQLSVDGEQLKQATRAKVSWPRAGAATIPVPAGADAVRVAATAVSVRQPAASATAADQVSVTAYDNVTARRLGGHGTAFRLTPPSGVAAKAAVGVEVDVAGFANAFGGDFESRLRLVSKPACVLKTPDDVRCAKGKLVRSHVDLTAHKLVADNVPVDGANVLVVIAAVSGETGSATATKLTSSSKWSVGLQSGDFNWSLPLPQVPAISGDAPDINLGYSSQAVDGMVAAENSQPSWVGQGWDLALPYIERRYKGCVDDGGDTGDLCWSGDELRISLDGTSSTLVKDTEAGADVWRAREDPGWRVQRHKGADNRDNDGEYWVVTTPQGTKYTFGRGKQATTDKRTESVYTVPVFGDDDGEPCHQGEVEESYCTQAWRWNLDGVVDAHGNSSTYFYLKEANRYARNGDADKSTSYTRGGDLQEIVYSQRSGEEDKQAPARMLFTSHLRCVEAAGDFDSCPSFNADNASSYPDVPLDALCRERCTGDDQKSPTFFTSRMLRSVTAQRSGADGGWVDVDRLDFTYAFPKPSDETSAAVWLEKVQLTGFSGGDELKLPTVEFTGRELSNRADADPGAGAPEMRKLRMTSALDELGRRIDITYGQPDPCPPGDLPPAYDTNTQNCFPGWRSNGESSGFGVWHKYLTTKVTVHDTAGTPPQVTSYRYRGKPAWHGEDDPLTPNRRESWGDWRGYGSVDVAKMSDPDYRNEDSSRAISLSRTLFFRGMDGDRTAGGGTRDVSVTDSRGTSVQDHAYLRGKERESQQFDVDGDGNATHELGGTIHGYRAAHVTSAKPGETDAEDDAHLVVENDSATRETVIADDGSRSSRTTRLATTHDEYGQATSVLDVAGDNQRCTKTSYARDDATLASWMVAFPYRIRTYAGGCDDPTELVNGKDQYYGGSSDLGGPIGKGDLTRTVSAVEAAGPNDVTETVSTEATFDAYGRTITETDGNGKVTRTEYSPEIGRPSTVTETNALDQAEVTKLDPDRQQPLSVRDPNGQTTTNAYDALGRLVSVREPDQDEDAPPTQVFAYDLDTSHRTPPRVTTKQLQSGDKYVTSWAFLDAQGRDRQTQEISPASTEDAPKTIVTDIRYDDVGNVAAESMPVVAPGQPGDALLNVPVDELDETRHTYDALGRDLTSTQYGNGKPLWKTTTEYFGDHIRSTPPQGGVASSSWSDARGRQIRKQEGSGDAQVTTSFTYTAADKLASVTDPAGHKSTYKYDLIGRRIEADDADAGPSRTTYDANSNAIARWDAKALENGLDEPSLSTDYDALNRPTARWAGASGTGEKISSWTYDSTEISNGIGRTAAQTTHQNGKDYTIAVTGYDPRGRVTSKQWTFPAGLGGLLHPKKYSINYGYNVADQLVSVEYPQSVLGTPAEKVTTGYDELGNPTTLTGTWKFPLTNKDKTKTYISGTEFASDGKLAARDYANPHHKLRRAYAYEDDSQRLSRIQTLVEPALGGEPKAKQDDTYSWDPAGNATSILDTTGHKPVATCFTYDDLSRLRHAWTTKQTDCADDDSKLTHDGPAGFNKSWTYSPDGNVTSARNLLKTKKFSYDDPEHPHAVTKAGHESYEYDANGAMTTKDELGLGLLPTTMEWDSQHRLKSSTSKLVEKTKFVYAPDGTRLARTDPLGVDTLYIDGQEIRVALGIVEGGTRYYQHGGTTVAERLPLGVLKWQFNDLQGSAQITALEGTSLLARTYYDPYGEYRPLSAPTATDRGWLGKVKDPSTGLSQLDARYYDSDLGRFLSPDPAFDPSTAQTMNSYAYAANNPIAYTDPTGLWSLGGALSSAWNGVKEGASAAWDWAKENKGLIADVAVGIGVGIAVGALCSTGVGCLVVAGVVAGAAGAAAGYGVDVAEGRTEASLGGFATRVGVGAAFGVAGGAIGKGLSAAAPRVVGAVARTSAGKAAAAGTSKAASAITGAASKGGRAAANTARAAGSKVAAVAKSASRGGPKAAKPQAGSRVASGAKTGASACSFAAVTVVLMADGERKPISKVKVGDKVVAADPETGVRTAKRVTKVWVHQDTLIGLWVGGKLITTTEDHPFWNATDRQFQRADRIDRGDKVLTASGKAMRVDGLAVRTAKVATAYNLTVEGIHTYFVGEDALLVHNTCGPPVRAVDGGVELTLRYKPGWSASQRAAADAKVAALNTADDLVVTPVKRAGTSASRRYQQAGGTVPRGSDVDHTIDLQLGGADDILNMNPLDLSVNRSLGSQIAQRIKGLDPGTRVCRITICSLG